MSQFPVIKFARINATADGDNTVIAAVTGAKIRVIGYAFRVAGTGGTVAMQDTAGTPVVHASFSLADKTGVEYAGGLNAPAFETAAGEGVEINNPLATDTLGHITYIET